LQAMAATRPHCPLARSMIASRSGSWNSTDWDTKRKPRSRGSAPGGSSSASGNFTMSVSISGDAPCQALLLGAPTAVPPSRTASPSTSPPAPKRKWRSPPSERVSICQAPLGPPCSPPQPGQDGLPDHRPADPIMPHGPRWYSPRVQDEVRPGYDPPQRRYRVDPSPGRGSTYCLAVDNRRRAGQRSGHSAVSMRHLLPVRTRRSRSRRGQALLEAPDQPSAQCRPPRVLVAIARLKTG
jgi:hypothetical protein